MCQSSHALSLFQVCLGSQVQVLPRRREGGSLGGSTLPREGTQPLDYHSKLGMGGVLFSHLPLLLSLQACGCCGLSLVRTPAGPPLTFAGSAAHALLCHYHSPLPLPALHGERGQGWLGPTEAGITGSSGAGESLGFLPRCAQPLWSWSWPPQEHPPWSLPQSPWTLPTSSDYPICPRSLTGISPFVGENDRTTLMNIRNYNVAFEENTFLSLSREARGFLIKVLVQDRL